MKQNLLFIALCLVYSLANAQFILNPENKKLSFTQMQMQFDDWKKTHDLKNEKGWKTYKRWEHEMLMKTNGNGNPANAETYLNELLKVYQHNKITGRAAGTWISVGPDVLPPSPDPYQQHGMGRTNCIAFHPNDPNTYWVGIAQGGVWKTTDNGASWTCLTDNLPITRVSDIAVDPNNTNTIYISLCDFEYIGFSLLLNGRKRNTHYGLGVYKTTDGGATWAPTALTFQLTNGDASLIRKVIIHPTNSNKIIAAGVNGFYTSSDAGSSWTKTNDSLFWDLVQDVTTPNTLYAATGFVSSAQTGGSSIMKSIDFGSTWTVLNTGIPVRDVERIKLCLAPSDANYIYAVATNTARGLYGVYRSVDAGTNWTKQFDTLNLLDWYDGTSTGGQGSYDLALLVNASDKNTIYVGGINLWSSTNGGTDFNPVSYWVGYYGPSIHADQHFLAHQPLTGNYFICNDGGIYRSMNIINQSWTDANNGNNWPTVWTDISNGMAISSFYRISSSRNSDNRIVAGAQDNSTSYFNGSTWSNVIGGDGMDNYISPDDNQTFIGSAQYGYFTKTTDGGNSFNDLNINPTGDNGEWTTPITADYNNQGVLYAGYGQLYKSTDYGDSWVPVSNFTPDQVFGYLPEISTVAVSNSNPSTIYLATRPRYEYGIKSACYKTNNGGATWTNITAGLADSLYITSVEISENDSNVAWVTCAGLIAGTKIFKTTNGGISWQNISYNLPNLPVNIVKHVPGTTANKILIGCDVGIYYIDDNTTTWNSYNTGLPNVIVTDFEINPAANKIYATTFGRAIWSTDLDVFTGSKNSKSAHPEISIYPNPVTQHSSIVFANSFRGIFDVVIYNSLGMEIMRKNYSKSTELFNQKLSLNYGKGLYTVKINCGILQEVKQIVIE